MDGVIKVGGSLGGDAAVLRALCAELGKLGERFKLAVVPGGGEFADLVRVVDRRFQSSQSISHKMAILGMDQYGLLLSDLIPKCRLAWSLGVIEGLSGSGHVVVLLPSRVVFRARSLEASWDVTSDSISGYVAGRLGVGKLILVTDVDGVFTVDPKVYSGAELIQEVSASGLLELSGRTSVDKFLPKLLLKLGIDCWIVNGHFPERIAKVLLGESTICTHIAAK